MYNFVPSNLLTQDLLQLQGTHSLQCHWRTNFSVPAIEILTPLTLVYCHTVPQQNTGTEPFHCPTSPLTVKEAAAHPCSTCVPAVPRTECALAVTVTNLECWRAA